jgi:hypothetical protein
MPFFAAWLVYLAPVIDFFNGIVNAIYDAFAGTDF